MAQELTYNLPGYGFANCYLYGQAIELVSVLEEIGSTEKMQNTCQLGTMRYVYPGAHHTRYEYVFTQLMLISNIVSAKGNRRNTELSLSSNLKEYKALGHKVSGGALMQCLAILSNAGHMYDTFTADKALLRLLCESKAERTGFYKTYRRNIPENVRKTFDEILRQGNYYKLHLFHIIHILQGMCRSEKHKQVCELCIHLLTQLIDNTLIKNEATERIFYLYKKVRKIAYLSVDMVYTPASFGANLSRMVYSVATYVDELFDENSVMNKSIQQLEEIIHQQIYDSSVCILNSSRIEQEAYIKYKKATKIDDIFQLRELLKEQGEYAKLRSSAQPKSIKGINSKTTLLLARNWNCETQKYDIAKEACLAAKLPFTRIAYGSQLKQNLKQVYTAYGLIRNEEVQRDTKLIIAHAITAHVFEQEYEIELVKFAIQSIYSFGEYYFNLTAPRGFALNDCVFLDSGSKKISKLIRKRFTDETVTDPNQLHEIQSCASFLESLDYSGTILCFVGGIKANKYNKTEKIDELDGFIYLPNLSIRSKFAYIIEAKNYAGGENDAVKQLSGTCKYLDQELITEVCAKSAICGHQRPLVRW